MMTENENRRRRYGFNAIELVVVILLIFAVLGVIVVILPKRSSPRWMQSMNHLKMLSLASNNANAQYKRLPPAFDQFGPMKFPASVHVYLLPYLEEDKLHKMYLAQGGKGNWDGFVIRPFVCPVDFSQTNNGAGIQNFAANLRVFSDKGRETKFDANMPALAGIEPSDASMPKSFPDGTSNTILFTTKYANCKDGGSRFAAAPDSSFAAFFGQNAALVSADATDPGATFQLQPTADECLIQPLLPQTMWQEFILTGMADGSVRTINSTVSPRTWNLLVQPNDDLIIPIDWQ
jgi:hypothetical protein